MIAALWDVVATASASLQHQSLYVVEWLLVGEAVSYLGLLDVAGAEARIGELPTL